MESSTPAMPAIPHEQLLPNIQQYYFSERIVRMLQREPASGELKRQSHHVEFVRDFALRNGNQRFLVRQLSRAFGCDAGRAKEAFDNRLNDPKVRGRRFAFDDDSEIEILEWI
jgi:hypothetical protein